MPCNTKLEDTLRSYGMKASHQRVAILQYLKDVSSHPTADEVYAYLVEEDECLSRATVYNTLNTFRDRGLVQEITIQKNQRRYDGDLTEHGHFLCTQCGVVIDLPGDTNNAKNLIAQGFSIENIQIFFYGRCPRCNQLS